MAYDGFEPVLEKLMIKKISNRKFYILNSYSSKNCPLKI